MKNKPSEEWGEIFEDKFCYKDLGPDADGYDAQPIVWNEYFKNKTDLEQIDTIEEFISQAIQATREETNKKRREFEKICTGYNLNKETGEITLFKGEDIVDEGYFESKHKRKE